MTNFKLGRRPGTVPVGLHDLTYYAAGPLPTAPPTLPVPVVPAFGDGTPWGMLGNDTEGDCGVAALEHGWMADAAQTGVTETPATSAQAISYYLSYTGGQDDGVVLSDYLASVAANGYYGRTVTAYAPVSINDVPTLQFAVDAYGFAYTGINVTQAMMTEAQGNPPWAWTAADAQGASIGGHCIPIVGYDDVSLTAITWGQQVQISYAAWHTMAEEAWAVITGELVAAGGVHGINLAALQADLARVGT